MPAWSCLALFVSSLVAADSEQSGKIRILLTTGGHGFQVEPFYAMFDAMKDIEYTKAEMPKDAELLKPGIGEGIRLHCHVRHV